MNHEITKTRFNVRRIAIAGILSALSIVLSYTPLGFSFLPGISTFVGVCICV